MKKIIAIALTFMMLFVMTACGKKPTGNNSSTDSSQEKQTPSAQENKSESEETKSNEVEVNPVELLFHPATSGSYATIKVDSSVKMDDDSAWLGLCPAGKEYVTELEADEVDVVWYSLETREKDDDPYVWGCDFTDVEDGTYALVVATSDDENVGYVAIQLTMIKDGENITFDFANAELKKRP